MVKPDTEHQILERVGTSGNWRAAALGDSLTVSYKAKRRLADDPVTARLGISLTERFVHTETSGKLVCTDAPWLE